MTLGQWHFQTADPLTVGAIILLLVSLVITIRAAFKRFKVGDRKARLTAVVLLNVIAFSAVTLLLLAPQTIDKSERGAVLVTDVTDLTIIEALGQPTYLAPDIANLPDYQLRENLIPLASIGQLALFEPHLTDLTLLGHGLSAQDWRLLPAEIQLDWQKEHLSGLVDVKWLKSVQVGEQWQVSARYLAPENTENGTVFTVALTDFTGAVLQSVRVRSGQFFSLGNKPKAEGNITYKISVIDDDKQTLQSEDLMLSAYIAPPIRMMVVQSAPSFETRHMVDWATGFGAALTIKTQISQDRFLTQTFNHPGNDAGTGLTSDQLERQDMLLLDGRAYAGFSAEQKAMLEEAVADGLGVMVMIDNDLVQALDALEGGILNGFSLTPMTENKTVSVPRWQNSTNETALPTSNITIAHSRGKTLVDDTDGRALSVVVAYGNGKVTVSTLRERHRWSTSGEMSQYSGYWAYILGHIARQGSQTQFVAQDNADVRRVGEKQVLCLLTAEEAVSLEIVPIVSNAVTSLPLGRDGIGAPRQCGAFWPQTTGWYHVQVNGPEAMLAEKYLYVYGENALVSHIAARRTYATQDFINQRRSKEKAVSVTTTYKYIDWWWLWLVFISSASILWLERKLDYTA